MKKFFFAYGLLWCLLFGALFTFAPELFERAFADYLAEAFKWKTFAVTIGALILALGLEWFFVGHEKSAINKLKNPSKSMKRDIATCLLKACGIFPVIGYIFLFGLPFFSGKFLAESWSFNFFQYIPSDFLKGLTALTLLSFFEYWAHRWSHEFRPLWAIHEYHHSATEMTVFSAHRNTPFAGVIMGLVTTIPFVFFGATLGSLWWVAVFRYVHDFLIHSEIDHEWGWIGRWVLVSPRIHRAHHSNLKKHYFCNYGFFIIFWDRVFGTYVNDPVTTFGAEEPVYNNSGFAKEMVWSLYKAAVPPSSLKKAPHQDNNKAA